MALQVWLPLNGNLNNNGLSEVTVTNNGATVNDSGKIGECYYFNGSSYIVVATDFSNYSTTSCSLSCWVKPPTASSGNKQILAIGTSSGWGNIRFGILYKTNDAKMLVTISNGNKYVSYNCSGEIIENSWNHVAAVYNNRLLSLYINGELANTYTTDYDISFSGITKLGVGAASDGAEKFTGYINDARIYDHALSPREVKEISKGLVLHYPLAMPGQENNIKASTIHNRGCNGFSYSSATNTWAMTAPIGSSAWGYGIVIDDTSIKWKSGESWVVSMEVYVPKAISWKHDINNKPDVSDTSPYTGNDYDDQRLYYSNGVMRSHNLQAGWNKIWFTQRAPATYGLFNYSTNFGIVTTNETSAIDIQIRNIKGEIISAGLEVKPTPWVPNPADTAYTALGFNDGIEYDVSGFQYNGEKYGNLKWSNNSAKYNACYEFDGSSDYIRLKQDLYSQFRQARDEVTVNIWAYKDDWDDYKNSGSTAQWMTMCGCQEGGGFSIYEVGNGRFTFVCGTGESSNSYKTSSTSTGYADSLSAGWHMFTLTFDGLSLKGYVDGNLVVSNAFFTTKTPIYYNTGTTSIYIGVESGSGKQAGLWWKGKLSDFRVYTTALSADDILELYHTPITLANNGVLMTQGEFEES